MHPVGCGCEDCAPEDFFCAALSDTEFAAQVVARVHDSVLVGLRFKAADAPSGESGGEEFLEEELWLAALLAAAIFERSREIAQELDALLDQDNPNLDQIHDALDRLTQHMSGTATETVRGEIADGIGRLINTGALYIAGGSIVTVPLTVAGEKTVMQGFPSVATAQRSIAEATAWALDNFAPRFIAGPVQQEISRLVLNSNPFAPLDLRPIRTLISQRLKNNAYWDVVANAAASRAYHYGYAKTAAIQGFTGYRFVAVIDNRTTPVCRAMNGRSFYLADALAAMEQVFASDDPEAVKEILPWPRTVDQAEAMAKAGFLIPPLHARCRSTIRAF